MRKTIYKPKPAKVLDIGGTLKRIAEKSNAQIVEGLEQKKEYIITLDGRSAAEYLKRIVKMMRSIEEDIDSEFFESLILDLNFLSNLYPLKDIAYEENQIKLKDVSEIRIDTRTGLPSIEDINIRMAYFNKILSVKEHDYKEDLKNEITKNPDSMPPYEIYYKIFEQRLRQKMLQRGIPPVPEEISAKKDGKIIYGNNGLDFFEININRAKIKGKPNKSIFGIKFLDKGQANTDFDELLRNRVLNNANFLWSQIQAISEDTKAKVTTRSVFFINKYTSNQDLSRHLEMPKITKDSIVLRTHVYDGKNEEVQYAVVG
jgi:hypothetical protein